MGRLTGLRRTLASVSRLLRLKNWWYAKIPPLLAIFYALVSVQSPAPGQTYLALAGILASLAFLFSFGYVVNDVFDVEQDRRAGRTNTMTGRTPCRSIGLCLLLAAGTFLPWLWMPFGRTAALLLAANLAFPLAYSIPPMRLKERGFCGIACDAAMVHLLPTLFVVASVDHLVSGLQMQGFRLAAIASAWAFSHGARGILIHQLQERESDEKAGVRTLAVTDEPQRMRALGHACFALELIFLMIFAFLLIPFTPLPLLVIVCYAAFDLGRHRAWNMPFDPVPVAKGTYVPPADLNEVWLPLALALALAARDLRLSAIPVLHIGLFFRDVAKRKYEIAALRTESRRRHQECLARERCP